MISIIKAVGVCQQVVALNFGFILFKLADLGLACSQSRDSSVDSGIVYFYDRCIRPSVVRRIIHGEHCFEREMFQEVYFTINITGCPVVLRFGSIRFQFDVYHRVVDLRFLEFGQSRI